MILLEKLAKRVTRRTVINQIVGKRPSQHSVDSGVEETKSFDPKDLRPKQRPREIGGGEADGPRRKRKKRNIGDRVELRGDRLTMPT